MHILLIQKKYQHMMRYLHLTKDFGIFQPDVHFGLTYDIVTADHDTAVNLTNGTRYVVQGKELPRFGYEFDIGVNARLTDNIVVGATYMGAYRKKYQERTGMLRLKYGF